MPTPCLSVSFPCVCVRIASSVAVVLNCRNSHHGTIFFLTDADQAERFSCANTAEETPWDCDLWDGLGTEFAYIHTGHFEWYRNGTTLSIAKKGAGLADIVNPCIQSLMGTEFYYDLCEKYDFVDGCYANEFFPDDQQIVETAIYDLPTNELPGDCSSGYCPCP